MKIVIALLGESSLLVSESTALSRVQDRLDGELCLVTSLPCGRRARRERCVYVFEL